VSAWLILSVLTAAANLFLFIAVRGRWGRLVPILATGSLIGAVAGNAAGRRLGLGLLRIGDFELVAASVAAQLAMLAVLLRAALWPSPTPDDDA
jgi:predicted DNA repair protein MutK